MANEQHQYSQEDAAELMGELSHHIGVENAIAMDALYEIVFGKKVQHKINDTRKLRYLVTALRKEGKPIASTPSLVGGGYYLANQGSELAEYIDRQKRRGIAAFVIAAKLSGQTLSEYFGQIQLNLQD